MITEAAHLNDLEIRIAHLERGMQELSDVLIRQQRELDRVVERNRILSERLAAIQEGGDSPEQDERPPHY